MGLKNKLFYPVLFILTWCYSIIHREADWDLFARLAVGKIFATTGQVLKDDIFSYTPTKEWIDHEWGSGVVFYFLSDWMGDAGLVLLKCLLFFTIFFLISQIIKLQNKFPDQHKNIIFYFIFMLAIIWTHGQTIRCQMFTFTFFTLWIYVLERVRRGETRLLWIIPATLPVWANLHGGFVAGIGLLGMYTAGEFLNRKPVVKYFVAGIPAVLLTLINPYGFDYWKFIFFATTLDRTKIISEWAATNLTASLWQWYHFKIILVIAAVSLLYYFIKNRPKYQEIDKVKLIVLGVTLYLSLSHIKHQFFFITSAACFLYHDFYSVFDSIGKFLKSKIRITRKILPALNKAKIGIVYTMIILAGLPFITYTPLDISVPQDRYPTSSVEFIRQNKIKGNLVSVFEWGSYIAWKLYPDVLIAIDGRFEEVYPMSIFYEVGMLINHKNFPDASRKWDYFLKKYDTDIVLASKKGTGRLKTFFALMGDENWKLVYQDKVSGVYIRKDKLKDSYIKPDIDFDRINKEKYINNINIK